MYAAHPILQNTFEVIPLSFFIGSQFDLLDVHALLEIDENAVLLECVLGAAWLKLLHIGMGAL